MRLASLTLVLGLFLGCNTYGTDTTRAVDEAPTLAVEGAPEEAVLVVDGIEFGPVELYSAATPVKVLPGRHIVEVKAGGRTIHREEIFFGSGSTTTVSVAPSQ